MSKVFVTAQLNLCAIASFRQMIQIGVGNEWWNFLSANAEYLRNLIAHKSRRVGWATLRQAKQIFKNWRKRELLINHAHDSEIRTDWSEPLNVLLLRDIFSPFVLVIEQQQPEYTCPTSGARSDPVLGPSTLREF
jgi:hypothetical protein